MIEPAGHVTPSVYHGSMALTAEQTLSERDRLMARARLAVAALVQLGTPVEWVRGQLDQAIVDGEIAAARLAAIRETLGTPDTDIDWTTPLAA